MKILEVVWFDAQSSMQLFSAADAKKNFKPRITTSVGYLVEDNKDYILLAFMKFGNDMFKHWQVIPKGMIKKQTVIKDK